MQFLKADTAATVLIGPAVDPSDGVTPVTDITLAAADTAGLRKHGGTSFTDLSSDGRTFTHIASGWYYLTLAQGDVDTEGQLEIVITDTSACLPIIARFQVVNANVYDSLFAAATTDYLQVDALQLGGATQSATDLKDFADTGYDPTTHKVQGVVLADGCTANSDMRGTDSAALASVVGALDDAAAAGEVTEADTLMQYIKQLINILIGDTGIVAFPSEAAPANGVSLAEVIRAIHADVTGLNGSAMRGTDSAALASAWTAALATALGNYTAARAGYLDELAAANLPTDVAAVASAIAALENISASEVNAEVVDALGTDTLSELTQAKPTATPTIKTALMLLYMIARNQIKVTSTELAVYNDAGTKIAKKTLSDDGTTFTESEMASGA